jgi:hypothetical protein
VGLREKDSARLGYVWRVELRLGRLGRKVVDYMRRVAVFRFSYLHTLQRVLDIFIVSCLFIKDCGRCTPGLFLRRCSSAVLVMKKGRMEVLEHLSTLFLSGHRPLRTLAFPNYGIRCQGRPGMRRLKSTHQSSSISSQDTYSIR